MKVGLIHSLDDRTDPAVAWQLDQLRQKKITELWLANPHEDAAQILKDLNLPADKVFDLYSQSYISEQKEGQGLWFYDLQVPNQAQLVVNKDWTKSIISDGQKIADVRWFAGSNRLVQAVSYQTASGLIDKKLIYQRNGELFAKQYFDAGQLLQSDFYLGFDKIQVQEFYFQGSRNFVLDARKNQYPSAESYLQSVVTKRKNCRVQIISLGSELSLAKEGTTLVLPVNSLADNQEIPPLLAAILTDDNHPIKKVLVNQLNYDLLKKSGIALDKVALLTD